MSSRIVVALRVAASADRAFSVFTNDIGAWWRTNPLFRFTPREPGVLSFKPGPDGRLIETRAGGKVFEIGRVSVWEPPSRLVFGWRQAAFEPGHATEVEVRFDDLGAETRVTVEHRGWDNIPTANAARHGFPNQVFLVRHGEYWSSLLSALNAFMGRSSPETPQP